MSDKFSERLNIPKEEIPISIRYEAPDSLRQYLYVLFLDFKGLSSIRDIVCRSLYKSPDPSNWGENAFMASEIQSLLSYGNWYNIYDLIEAFNSSLQPTQQKTFTSEINNYFVENGIGWKLHNGKIETRGDQYFEETISKAEIELNEKKLTTAKNEIKQAIGGLSRRPSPDITGAIQHSMASLECVSREITGDLKMTLGQLINEYPDIVPAPLNRVITLIWGYSSEQGRHLREGREPNYEEAELLVGLSCILCTYLAKKHLP